MSQGDCLDWLNEDYGDRYVQRKLETELQDAYAFQARESSAIRSQMAQLTGSIEQRLDRLTKAFYAFVELSDVRAELAVFEGEASVRHAALRLLRSLVRRAAALAEAQELDPVRTAVFRSACLAVAGRAGLAVPLLPAALQEAGEQVTYAQRALWQACAHGVYGDPGAALVGEWLAGRVGGLDAGAAAAEGSQWGTAAWQAFKVTELPGQLPRGLSHALSQHDQRR